jgi:ACS family hexuronate transporter-like MFS transporter
MRIPNLRWWIAAMLFLSTVINYIDRQTLSVLAPVLKQELGITDVQYSNILTAFLAAYTVMYVGSGILVDRFGTRLALGGFMVWWSLANMAHALARGAWSLGGLRFLLGLGESGNFMAAFKAVSEWYPARERAFVHGLVQAGAAIGAIVGELSGGGRTLRETAAPAAGAVAGRLAGAFLKTGFATAMWLALVIGLVR